MKGVAFSPRRVGLIAHNTLREAARQRLFHFLLLLALGLTAGAQYLRDFNFGASELKFIADFGLGALAFFGAVLTVVATAQLFFSEIESRTVLTLLAKPVWRAEFVLGKFFGVVAVMAVFCALLTGLLAAVLMSREAGMEAGTSAVNYGTLAMAGLLQWLKFCVLAALTLLVASYAQTQLFSVAMGLLLLVIGHLKFLANDAYGRAGAGVLWGVIGGAFPNFQLFNLADPLAAEAVAGAHIGRVVVYGVGYAAMAGGLAVFCFRRREI